MSEYEAPNVSERAVIRAVRSEAHGDERTRMLDLLRQAAHANEQAVARHRRPASTAQGRRAAGLRAAIELIETAEPTHMGEEWSTVGSLDSVGVYHYDPPEEPDEMPVRLVAWDGADNSIACVYLSIDEAERHFADGLRLVDKLRAARAERLAGESSDQAESA